MGKIIDNLRENVEWARDARKDGVFISESELILGFLERGRFMEGLQYIFYIAGSVCFLTGSIIGAYCK